MCPWITSNLLQNDGSTSETWKALSTNRCWCTHITETIQRIVKQSLKKKKRIVKQSTWSISSVHCFLIIKTWDVFFCCLMPHIFIPYLISPPPIKKPWFHQWAGSTTKIYKMKCIITWSRDEPIQHFHVTSRKIMAAQNVLLCFHQYSETTLN
jgi:hypothetical protein